MAITGLAVRGPRSLLRQIREALAGGGPAQVRLDMVVRIIALSMVAEVCSLYLRRASSDLELFATEGLNPDAVHNTRLKPGEDLQIIAMVLAEMVAGGELVGQEEMKDVELAPHKPERLKGVKFAEGLAYGVAVLHEAPVPREQLLSDDATAEEARLKEAIAALQTQIDEMMDGQHGLVGASFEVIETYRMFAHSRGWNRSLEEAVRSGLTAEAAVERVRSEHRATVGQARDPYLRERLHDLEDLNDRLLRHLSGDGGRVHQELPDRWRSSRSFRSSR